MHLVGWGINHKFAPISIREQLAFDSKATCQALHHLLQNKAANEAVLVSTCNRTEIYAWTLDPHYLKNCFWTQLGNQGDLNHHSYDYYDADCVRHLIRVACGLDSMALGEPQILGQIKQAYQLACEAGTVGPELRHLFPAVFAASKQIRHHSHIGANSISLAYTAVQLGKRIFSQISKCHVLLVGAGDQIGLLANYLLKNGIKHFTIANRHIEKAQLIAEVTNGKAIQLGDIPAYLPQIDWLICATRSPLPLVGKGMVESAIRLRKHKPMLMIDLAVPRDIEPEVAQLEDVYLYNIDDLQEILSTNLKNRTLAAEQAESLVEFHTEYFMRKLRIFKARSLIQQFRQQIHSLRDHEVRKALSLLNEGENPKKVIDDLARRLTNKILHQPTIKLRQAASEKQQDVLHLIQQLLEV